MLHGGQYVHTYAYIHTYTYMQARRAGSVPYSEEGGLLEQGHGRQPLAQTLVGQLRSRRGTVCMYVCMYVTLMSGGPIGYWFD